MALDRWMKGGRMSAPLTRTTRQIFWDEVERGPNWRESSGGSLPILHPPRGRMLLFRSAPEITNRWKAEGCHLVWDRKSSSERPRPVSAATTTMRLSSSPLCSYSSTARSSSSLLPEQRSVPRPSAFGGETACVERDKAAFFSRETTIKKDN